MRIRATLLAGFLFGIMALAAAPAGATLLPPGHSAADQYRESIPGVTGNRVPDGDDRTADEVLGDENAAALREAGPDGEAAAEMAVSGAPEDEADAAQKQEVRRSADRDGEGGAPKIASIATGISGGEGGLGPILPILVLTAIVGFTGIAVGRRRRFGSTE